MSVLPPAALIGVGVGVVVWCFTVRRGIWHWLYTGMISLSVGRMGIWIYEGRVVRQASQVASASKVG